jgi:hypothetical protein
MKSIKTIVVYRSMKLKRILSGGLFYEWLWVAGYHRSKNRYPTNKRSQGQKDTVLNRSYCLFNIDHIDLL